MLIIVQSLCPPRPKPERPEDKNPSRIRNSKQRTAREHGSTNQPFRVVRRSEIQQSRGDGPDEDGDVKPFLFIWCEGVEIK